MTAASILRAAIGHMEDRAETYDKPEGERSMGATVAAFQAVTGVAVTEEQGWLFMALLKAVRSQQGAYRADSYEDGAAYFALAGEAAARDRNGGWTSDAIKASALRSTVKETLTVEKDCSTDFSHSSSRALYGEVPPHWATHVLEGKNHGREWAVYKDGQYLSQRGRIYNMRKWSVVKSIFTTDPVCANGQKNQLQACLSSSPKGGPLVRCVGCTNENCMC